MIQRSELKKSEWSYLERSEKLPSYRLPEVPKGHTSPFKIIGNTLVGSR